MSNGKGPTVQYEQLDYVPEEQDPSLTLETSQLVAKVIDNTGLLAPPSDSTTYFQRSHVFTPFTHHLGYHGIRTLYRKDEKRNMVVPFASWLNLQTMRLEGIDADPVDERAWAGAGRGWPLRLSAKGDGAVLRLEPQPSMQMRYALELQPAEPDGIDFHITFELGRRPESGPARLHASWPCYMNAYDDVRLFYPKGAADNWAWACLGEKPDFVIGDPVGYEHAQQSFVAVDQALPLGYGRIGEHCLILMFDDPRVRLFLVNAGGHMFCSPVQNPAWDFEWVVDDYPINEPLGFSGRLIYTRFESEDLVLQRYRDWAQTR